jgi:hypothetical protein
MFKIFNKQKESLFVERGLYVVKHGDHIGRFFTIMTEKLNPNTYSILFFPECEPVYIGKKDMEEGHKDGIFELVKKLPKDVFKSCEAEFKLRLKDQREVEERANDELNSGRKQSDPSDSLGEQESPDSEQ